MREIMNAEISIGTIKCLSDALSYLKWTFYSRRVKMNPSYYGAKSASEEDIEDFYLEVVNDTMARLQEHGCVVIIETEGTDSLVSPTSLGQACSNFYLLHRTPLQMKKGNNSLRKVLSRHANTEQNGEELPLHSYVHLSTSKRVKSIQTFSGDGPMYNYAVAKILFELSLTHGSSTSNFAFIVLLCSSLLNTAFVSFRI